MAAIIYWIRLNNIFCFAYMEIKVSMANFTEASAEVMFASEVFTDYMLIL